MSNPLDLYVIKFKDGSYAKGNSWDRSKTLKGAKVYTSIGPARGAITYHGRAWARQEPKLHRLTVFAEEAVE